MKDKITRLKKEKNAIILAHYYTLPEVQDVADFVGDSLALSQKAAATDADIILFAGVHFMAETAKILNPRKKVLIPDLDAGCCLADDCSAERFADFLKDYPNHTILSYINCSAGVKALSDIIVTSGNALKIVKSLPENEKIVFAPDKNLGHYICQTLGREMVLWDGVCHVHDRIKPEHIASLINEYPDAQVIAHPECRREVLALANFVGSTAAMLKHVAQSQDKTFIVVTERGILYELTKQNPGKIFIPVNASVNGFDGCRSMKLNNLDNIYQALVTEQPELILDDELSRKAKKAIDRMLSY